MKKKKKNTNTKKIRLFVYGTLKKGKALHESYNFHKQDFVGEDKVKGELYGLGWYPVLFETGENVRFVPGEVYDVEFETFNKLREMEEAAGYTTKTAKTMKGLDAFVFYYTHEHNRIPRNMIKEF